jgi:hypothetical protein
MAGAAHCTVCFVRSSQTGLWQLQVHRCAEKRTKRNSLQLVLLVLLVLGPSGGL